jgi:hypothetical protein
MPAECCKKRYERLLREDPEMPVFTLLGKDSIAIETVKFWMKRAKELSVNPEKMKKVQDHLDALIKYKQDHPEKIQIPD